MTPAWMTVAALAIQAAAFWSAVFMLPASTVGTAAWLALYACCAATLAVSASIARMKLGLLAWLQVLFYALLLAAIFFGADFALDTLRGAVRPRSQLPAFFNGLEFYFVLAPGVASIAVGGAARSILARSCL